MSVTPIAELRVPVSMGGRDYTMIFNANTMSAYEQVTGKFFLKTVDDLIQIAFPNGPGEPMVGNVFDILNKFGMGDLRALLWASIHDYDEKDRAVWPLTIFEVGRLLQLKDILPAFMAFLKGNAGNSPSRTEMGESPAEVKTKQNLNSPPKSTPENGGERGTELPEDAFV